MYIIMHTCKDETRIFIVEIQTDSLHTPKRVPITLQPYG